ncbi:MAG: CoA-binding protein, partial [Acidobacteriota bacterium]
ADAGPVDRVTVYLPPALSKSLLGEMKDTGASEIFFNPGSADRAVFEEAERIGAPAIDQCSIVELGLSPSQFGDV